MPAHEAAAAVPTAAAHGWHFAAAAAFVVAGLAAAAIADARDPGRRRTTTRPAASVAKPLLFLCIAATLGAAAVHVYVTPEHFAESPLYGAFFVCLATVQLGWAAWMAVRPSRPLLAAGVAANVAVVMLWTVSRFIAVPLGPGAGTREEIGRLDLLATSCELVVIVTAALMLAGAQTLKRNSVTSPSAIT